VDIAPLFTESHCLRGPSALLDAPGVALEVPAPHGHNGELLRGWAGRVTWMGAAVGWTDIALTMQRHANGTTLAFTAPHTALRAARALNEWSLEAAAEEYLIRYDASALAPERLHLDQPRALEGLRRMILAEAKQGTAGTMADDPLP
jgi:hypothetical protein